MPIDHVNVWEGFGWKYAKTVIRGKTKVFVDLGIPQHAVEIVIHEIPKSHWGIAGEPASERLKDETRPKKNYSVWNARLAKRLMRLCIR